MCRRTAYGERFGETGDEMAGIIESFKQGFEGRDTGHFSAGGVPVTCQHCGGDEFDTAAALLNTRGLTFLGLDFANRDGYLLVCRKCTHIDWFLEEPQAL